MTVGGKLTCPGTEATLFNPGWVGPISDSFVVPDNMCVPAGTEIDWWVDDNTATALPACTNYEGQNVCEGGDAYTSMKSYGYVDMSKMKPCPG